MSMAQAQYVTAEIEYRRDRMMHQISRSTGRRHWVPRRPSLHLPRPRRRPLSLA